MLASLTRTKTFWLLAVVVVGYGIITLDDDDPTDSDAKKDDMVKASLEVTMTDPTVASINVAIAATLGSAGNFHARSVVVPEWFRTKKEWKHHFQARRGDALNAEVANLSGPVLMFNCTFTQYGAAGWESEITRPEGAQVGTASNGLARCAAVVH